MFTLSSKVAYSACSWKMHVQSGLSMLEPSSSLACHDFSRAGSGMAQHFSLAFSRQGPNFAGSLKMQCIIEAVAQAHRISHAKALVFAHLPQFLSIQKKISYKCSLVAHLKAFTGLFFHKSLWQFYSGLLFICPVSCNINYTCRRSILKVEIVKSVSCFVVELLSNTAIKSYVRATLASVEYRQHTLASCVNGTTKRRCCYTLGGP